jgi:hypothetical protein
MKCALTRQNALSLESYQQYDTLGDWTLLAPSLPVTALPCVRSLVVFHVPLREFESFCGSRRVGMSNHFTACHTVPSLRISFADRLPHSYSLRYMCLFNLSENISTMPWYQVLRICAYNTSWASSSFIICLELKANHVWTFQFLGCSEYSVLWIGYTTCRVQLIACRSV